MRLLRALGSVQFALIGFGFLFIVIFIRKQLSMLAADWLIFLVFVVLSFNLFVALFLNRTIRQSLLLTLFHLCLIVLLLLAAIGRMLHFSGQIELAQGQSLSKEEIIVSSQGPWYRARVDALNIEQGPIEVNYAPQIYRQKTFSHLIVRREDKPEYEAIVGDDIPLKIKGYRLYTTPNKGFSVIVSWSDKAGNNTITGSINFPSFPAKEWSQHQQWITPAGEKLFIEIEPNIVSDANNFWRLSSKKISASVRLVTQAGSRQLVSGKKIALQTGSLQLERVGLWMGYKISYVPTLQWMFITAVLGVGLMAWYMQQRISATARVVSLSLGEI